MIFKPHPLSTSRLPASELEKDRKSCRKIGPCGVGKKAIYLNSFYIDRCYYIPFTAIRRVFKRVAMSKGGFSGRGVFASMPYLVVEYDDGQQKQCNFKYENQVDDLLNLLSAEQPQIRLLSEAAERKMEKQKAEMELELLSRLELTPQSEKAVKKLERAIDYLERKPQLSEALSQAAGRWRNYQCTSQAIAGWQWLSPHLDLWRLQQEFIHLLCTMILQCTLFCLVLQLFLPLPVSVFCQLRATTEKQS